MNKPKIIITGANNNASGAGIRALLTGEAAALAGAVLVDGRGEPVTLAPELTEEEVRSNANHSLAVVRALQAGPLQVHDFEFVGADGEKLEAPRLVSDRPHRCRDRNGNDYLFDGLRLLRARPKRPGGKKARRRAKAAAQNGGRL